MVTPAQVVHNLLQRGTGFLAHQIHGDLAGPDNLTLTLITTHALDINDVITTNTLQNLGRRQARGRFGLTINKFERLSRYAHRKRDIMQRSIGNYAVKGTLKLAYTATFRTSDILDH